MEKVVITCDMCKEIIGQDEMINLPRKIDPATIQPGDRISVALPTRAGLSQTVTGTVAVRQDQGHTALFLTREGGVVFAWRIGSSVSRVTLLSRGPVPQQELDFNFNDVIDSAVTL